MHKEGLSERLRIRITPALKERLERRAERNERSVSEYVRHALQEKINDEILSDIDRKL
ncbi:plasmid mobilization protein [Salinibacter ruber]|jgi:predicted HicB family RNase H-like nuclease|uniref:HicB family RNase H-like nuclease n=2 Tax=Salinibacter ruber TaxID=146919 RepID=A0A9X2TGY2_9BACT|nr:putative HicB family RNase H-like nuclease [Salinibacter ruber]MCS3629277.1 putative HicB family RNase H-like nuclease [Salinibacter ruber]MCS3662336.1 putative HicB family RNase H-like nuclease [Salinibacter ruber]MCS3712135.1 putative HicB family RNase H-like nuclease [Salinibacter ruber]MCS4146185.1 putative HicB family RNase H-like nuclease [Salinibacter ruber]